LPRFTLTPVRVPFPLPPPWPFFPPFAAPFFLFSFTCAFFFCRFFRGTRVFFLPPFSVFSPSACPAPFLTFFSFPLPAVPPLVVKWHRAALGFFNSLPRARRSHLHYPFFFSSSFFSVLRPKMSFVPPTSLVRFWHCDKPCRSFPPSRPFRGFLFYSPLFGPFWCR